MKSLISSAVVVVCLGFVPATSANDQPVPFVEEPGLTEFSGQLIARPVQASAWDEQGLGVADANERIDAARRAMSDYVVHEYVWQTDEYVFFVPDGSTENEVSSLLMATGDFEYVEPNWLVYPVECPDDPRLTNQWHHNANRMNSCAGWDMVTGDPSIVVGICDTGIQTSHPEFQLNRQFGYNAVNRVWETAGNNSMIQAVHPHGTMTTGCAAANGDNGQGGSGVGWNLGHRMMRVSNSSGGGSSMNVLTHAARTSIEAGDKVANVSYSGVSNSSVRTTGTYIKSIGGLLTWSAGNDGANRSGNRDGDDVIVVGATTSSDNKASFSAYGSYVDLVAPGAGVYTTNTGSSYARVDGTSFSAPLTAGLIALIWSADPDLTPDEVEQILKEGCDDLGASGVDNIYGHGRINVFNSLSLLPNPLEFAYPDGLPTSVDPSGGTTVRVQVSGLDSQPEPGTGMFYYDIGAGFESVAMDVVSQNVYDAVFPASECQSEIAYYFSAETTGGEVVFAPGGAPNDHYVVLSATGIDVVLDDDFETDQGWIVGAPGDDATSGIWARGDPVATGGTPPSKPEDDHSEDGTLCFVTDLTTADVDGGHTTLRSPIFDMTSNAAATLSYWRWYSNGTGLPMFSENYADIFVIDISNDGGESWVNVETLGPGDASDPNVLPGWNFYEFLPADVVTPTANMQMRFIASDEDGDSVIQALIDDFLINEVLCDSGCYADFNDDGVVNTLDFLAYLNAFNAGDAAADCSGDGTVNTLDFLCFLNEFNAGC